MAASWLTQALGPNPPSRTVSVTRNAGPTFQPQQQPGFDLNALMKQMQGQYSASNNAGLEQYKNLLASVNGTTNTMNGLYDQAESRLSGMGTSAHNRIASNMVQGNAADSQDLVSRGLYNSTIAPSMSRGRAADAEVANQQVDEGVNAAKSGLTTQRAGATMDMGRLMADSILSKQNQGPDASMYANLIAQLARSGGLNGSFPSGAGSYGASGPGGGGRPTPTPTPTGGSSVSNGTGVQTFTGQGNGDTQTRVLPMSDPQYWIGQGYRPGPESYNMAQRYRNA